MKNQKLKKALLLVVSAMLLVSISVVGTIAYLTDTESVTNTFTVGKVYIALDEADVNPDGTYVDDHDTRVDANKYHLLPGHTYYKDPTVTVLKDSEDCYVRMLVTVKDFADLAAAVKLADTETVKYTYTENGTEYPALHMLVSGWKNETWEYKSVKTVNGSAVYEFWYTQKVAKNTTGNTVLPDLFETITLPGAVDNAALAKLAEVEVNVVAHAIQADGFDDAAEAWSNWAN